VRVGRQIPSMVDEVILSRGQRGSIVIRKPQ
jgi:hypothetical protein